MYSNKKRCYHPPLSTPSFQPPKSSPSTMDNQREINWTDSSESDSEVDLDEVQDQEQAAFPRSPPRRRLARGPMFRVNAERAADYRRFWYKCLVGTFIDSRQFTIRRLQSNIDAFWTLRGVARVVGDSEKNFIIHFENDEDRAFI